MGAFLEYQSIAIFWLNVTFLHTFEHKHKICNILNNENDQFWRASEHIKKIEAKLCTSGGTGEREKEKMIFFCSVLISIKI